MNTKYYQIAISGFPGSTLGFKGENEWDYVAGGQEQAGQNPAIEVIEQGPLLDYSITPSGHHLASNNFRNAVSELWGNAVTWYDVSIGKEKLWLFRPNAIIDALDIHKSSISWNKSKTKIVGVSRIVIRQNVDCGEVFVLRGWEVALLISRRSAQKIISINPLGIDFYEV